MPPEYNCVFVSVQYVSVWLQVGENGVAVSCMKNTERVSILYIRVQKISVCPCECESVFLCGTNGDPVLH